MRDENEAGFTKMFRLIKMIPTSDELTFFELLRQFHLFMSGIHAIGVKPPRWPFCPLTSAPLYWNGCVWRMGLKSTLEPSPYGGVARGCKIYQYPVLFPGIRLQKPEKWTELNLNWIWVSLIKYIWEQAQQRRIKTAQSPSWGEALLGSLTSATCIDLNACL